MHETLPPSMYETIRFELYPLPLCLRTYLMVPLRNNRMYFCFTLSILLIFSFTDVAVVFTESLLSFQIYEVGLISSVCFDYLQQ